MNKLSEFTVLKPLFTLNPPSLVTASLSTRESPADPSYPGRKYKNFILRSQAARVLVAIWPFRVRYRGSKVLTSTFMYVPSRAPIQPYM